MRHLLTKVCFIICVLCIASFGCGKDCPPGQTDCDGQCRVLQTDIANCGACGTACQAGQVCTNGQCLSACTPEQLACDGLCINPKANAAHCGSCGVRCTQQQVCSDGQCVAQCPAGQQNCGGACVDRQTNAAHCGACGIACQKGTICRAGSCTKGCPTGQTECNGTCTHLQSNPSHCGGCGIACGSNQTCSQGVCVDQCQASTTNCDGTCVNTQDNPEHCGACGKACYRDQRCHQGRCVVGSSCTQSRVLCDRRCVLLNTDNDNCGSCGNKCAQGSTCLTGSCQPCPDCLRSSFTFALSRSKGDPALAVAFGPNGDTYLAGRLDKDLTFGSQQPRYRSLASFVARFTPSGQLVWLAISDNTVMTGALTVDAKGNAYVVGACTKEGQFGDIRVTPFQNSKKVTTYIAKIDPKGAWVWAKSIGEFNQIRHIKADNQGNTIIAGTHIGPLAIGTFQLKANTDKKSDIFVAKVGPKGQVLWVQDFKETHSDAPYALALDINGNIYLTGVTGVQKLPSRTTHNGLAADLFVRKMDVDGQTFWLKRIQSPTSNEEGRGIAVDTKGNIYVTGIYSHALKLGETLLSNDGNGLHPRPFVAKLDYKGNWLWAKGPKLTSPNTQAVTFRIAANGQGHIVITGTTTGNIDFGNEQRIIPNRSPGKDTLNDFLVQYRPDGQAIHAVLMDSSHIKALSISAQNMIHLGVDVRGTSIKIGQTTLDLRSITPASLSVALPMKR